MHDVERSEVMTRDSGHLLAVEEGLVAAFLGEKATDGNCVNCKTLLQPEATGGEWSWTPHPADSHAVGVGFETGEN